MLMMLIVIGWVMLIWSDVIFIWALFISGRFVTRNLMKNCLVSPIFYSLIEVGIISY